MPRLRSAAIAIGLSLMLGQFVAASAGAADDMTARRQALEPYFRMYRPDGAGPFPALLFVSGCSGFAPSIAPQAYIRVAESWRARGYVVAFVDYLSARGLPNCRSSALLTPAEIGKDILAVASYLRTQPLIIPARITAIGWSLGGGGVLAALGQIDPSESSPLHSVIAYYPYCRNLQPWRATVPVLILMGAKDEVAPPAGCQEVFEQLPPGTPVETRIYPEARHGFDVPELPPYVRFGNEILGHRAAAAAASRDIEQFITRPTFGGGKTAAESGSPQPQVPTACAAAWASYAAAKGSPVRPGTYYVKGQPWTFETLEITIQKVAENHVWVHVHYIGDSSAPLGPFDVVEDTVATLIGNDTFFWRTPAGTSIRLKQFDTALGGYMNSVYLMRQCMPMTLTEVKSGQQRAK